MDALKNVSKKTWTTVGTVIIIIALVFGGIYFWNHRRISILSNGDLNVHFTGYDGSGQLVYNSGKMERAAMETMAKRVKLGDYWTNKLKEKPYEIQTWQDEESGTSTDDRDKLSTISEWYSETKVSVSKYQNLSNGDKVTIKVDTGNDKSNPIKQQSKDFKVKGLKKVKSVSANSILNDLKVSFSGFNGHGQAVLKSQNKKLDALDFTVKKNGALSNGDKVTIKAPADLFKKDGLKYTGNKYITATVSGLMNISKIANVKKVQKVSDSLIDDEYPSDDIDHYVNTFKAMYAVPTVPNGDDDSDYDDTSDDSDYDDTDDESTDDTTVTVNSDTVAEGKSLIDIHVLYEVVDSDDDDADPDYYDVTLKGLKYDSDSNVNIDKLNTDDDSEINSVDGLSTQKHNLAADGMKVK